MTKPTLEQNRASVITALVVTGFGIGCAPNNHKNYTPRHKATEGFLQFFVPLWLRVRY